MRRGDEGRSNSGEPGMTRSGLDYGFWTMVLLSGVAFHTCLGIEIANHRAGGILPREMPDVANPKWRHAHGDSEAEWRKTQAYSDRRFMTGEVSREKTLSQWEHKLLSAEERTRMNTDVAQARAENALYGLVSTWGLLQYVIAPMGLVCSFRTMFSERIRLRKAISALLASVTTISIILMFQRAYFGSLGW